MGRRTVRLLLGIFYVVLLAALLITHTRQISGEPERAMALAETLLLATSAVVVLVLYVRINESGAEDPIPGQKGEEPSGAPDVPQVKTMEQLRGRITAMERAREKGAASGQTGAASGQTGKDAGGSILTEREWEIAWLLYRGYSNRQIAEEYCIAETTVKKHVSHIYEKLQVSGRKEFKEKYKG